MITTVSLLTSVTIHSYKTFSCDEKELLTKTYGMGGGSRFLTLSDFNIHITVSACLYVKRAIYPNVILIHHKKVAYAK